MADIINGKDARALRDSTFEHLRNKWVFHFDMSEIGKQIQKLEHPVFFAATGKTNGGVYYEIADACAVEALTESMVAPGQDVSNLIEQATKLLVNFVNSAERFMTAYLKKEGWRVEIRN